MDVAYDKINEEVLSQEESAKKEGQDDESGKSRQPDLRSEIQDTYKTFSESSWGTRITGFWGSVRKQVGSCRPTKEAQADMAMTGGTVLRNRNSGVEVC